MAHLNEKNELIGSLGNLVFKVIKGKIVVQTKPNKKNFKQSKSSKKAALDFGRASHLTQKINAGLQEFLQNYHSPDMYNRLRSKILSAMRAQSSLPLGEKDLWDGTPKLLEGFEFNRDSPYANFADLWLVNWQVDAQRRIHFQQEAFTPKNQLHWLPFTGRLEICYWISAFRKEDYKPCQQQLIKMLAPPTYNEVAQQSFTSEPLPSDSLVFVVGGLLYYKLDPVLGEILLNHKQCHPMRILKVFKV